MKGETVRVVVFKREDWWVACALDYNIATQAKRLDDLYHDMEFMVLGRAHVAKELGLPFQTVEVPQKTFQRYLAQFESVPSDQAKRVQLQVPEGVPCPVSTLEFRVVDTA